MCTHYQPDDNKHSPAVPVNVAPDRWGKGNSKPDSAWQRMLSVPNVWNTSPTGDRDLMLMCFYLTYWFDHSFNLLSWHSCLPLNERGWNIYKLGRIAHDQTYPPKTKWRERERGNMSKKRFTFPVKELVFSSYYICRCDFGKVFHSYSVCLPRLQRGFQFLCLLIDN